MGTIINARREPDQSYQYCKIYEALVTPSIGGWGVRARDSSASGGNVICVRYPLTRGTILSTVSFIVNGIGVGTPKNLYVGVWGQSPTIYPTRIYRVGTAVISEEDVGGSFGSIAGIRTTVRIEPILVELPGGALDMQYFLSFTGENVNLEMGTTTLGSSVEYSGATPNINDPSVEITYIDESEFSDNEEAVSIEAWGRVDKWTRIETGGTIVEDSDEWQVAGTYYGSWSNVENTFIDDASEATADGRLYIDLGAGIEPAVPWNDESATLTLDFPDYDEYGVRALCQLTIKGTINDATNELTIMYCDQDTSSIPSPAAGWENLDLISGAGAFDNTYYIPQIARWIQIVQTTENAATDDVSFIQITQLGYAVEDGKFTVDHSQVIHNFWVDNYPTADAVYKLQVANMAGAESETSTEFTNRINKD